MATPLQSKSYSATAGAGTHNLVFDSAPTSGNLVIIGIVGDAVVSTVGGGAYTRAIQSVDFVDTTIWYRAIGAAESATIAIVLGSSTVCCIRGIEYPGMLNTVDKTASALSSDATIESGTTAATTVAAELLVAITGQSSIGTTLQTINSWSNSFVQDVQLSSTAGAGPNVRLGLALRTVAATGTYSSVATLAGSSGNASGAIATFGETTRFFLLVR